jgi:amino acid adenylation domain-containing protein
MVAQIQGYRLSPQQARVWTLHEQGSAYRAQLAVLIDGNLDRRVLHRSLKVVLERHETFRTSFHSVPGLKLPIQVITDDPQIDWREVSLSEAGGEYPEEIIDDYLLNEGLHRFDLQNPMLVRSLLLRFSSDRHALLVNFPSICADGRTLTNLVHDIGNEYTAAITGEHLSPEITQYVQFSEWQNELIETEEEASEEAPPWRDIDIGGLLATKLPFEQTSEEANLFRPRVVRVTFEGDVLNRIEGVSGARGASAASFFLSCCYILLWRLTGESKLLFGSLCDGRKYDELQETAGLLASYLPAACNLEAHSPFYQVLDQTHRLLRELDRWQEHFAWRQIVSEQSGRAFFPFVFEYEAGPATLAAGDVTFSLYQRFACIDRFKVRVSCRSLPDSTIVEIAYDAGLFLAEDIGRLAEQYRTLVCSAADTPRADIGRLNLVGDGERKLLLREFNNSKKALRTVTPINLLIEEWARRTPHRIAAVSEGEQLTYGALNDRANLLAHHLRGLGAGPEQLVALCTGRSVGTIVAILGILKCGAAYLPLEPAHPPERLRAILEDSGAAVLITDLSLLNRLPQTTAEVICLDRDWAAIESESDIEPPQLARPENIAYVIYTSGSTGRPKGVAVEHRQLLNYIRAIESRFSFRPEATFALVSTFAADLGHTVIYPALCGGGTLHVISQDKATDPAGLADYFLRHHIEFLKIVPSHLAALTREVEPLALLPGKGLILGGEACPWELTKRLQAVSGGRRILNHYGPTETTVGVLTYDLAASEDVGESKTLPLGRPVPNTEVYLLDSRLELEPVCAMGELYVGGSSVSRGYWRRPEQTAERFLPDPFSETPGSRLYKTGDVGRFRSDGNVQFSGRVDDQVKVRGYRIELGEIEAALREHPAVQEAVVLAPPDRRGENRLVAYVVHKRGKAPDKTELIRSLRQLLPEYMIPAAFVVMKALPLTANGKIARTLLPAHEQLEPESQEGFASPRDAVEEILVGIWSQVLERERIGVHDNFFEIGGHSLSATQVMSRIRSAFHVEIPVRQIFESPTIGELADSIRPSIATSEASQPDPIECVSRADLLPLSFAQRRLWFIDQLIPGIPAYNIPRVVPIAGPMPAVALEQGLSEVVRRHEVLRTRFVSHGDEPIQVIDPPRPVSFAMADLEGLARDERYACARRLVEQETDRPFDLSRGPLLRASVLRLSPGEHIALMTLHHIVSDAWSARVLEQEMTLLHRSYRDGEPSLLPELAIQFADYANWQRERFSGELLQKQLTYWRNQLAGSPPLVDVPTDRSRPAVQSYRAESQRIEFSAETSAALRRLSQSEAVTLYMTLLAGFMTLLARYSGQRDIVVGVPIAGRNRVEIEKLIGFFINTLAVRTELSETDSFRLVLRRVREALLGAYANQDLPFDKLVEELEPERKLSHTPLFQSVFMFDNTDNGAERTDLSAAAGDATIVESWTAKFDLTLSMKETADRIVGSLKYSTDLFNRDRIARMLDHFRRILEQAVSNPDSAVWELPLLGEDERHHLLVQWNDTEATYESATAPVDLFEMQVRQTPDLVAVVFEQEQITYLELNRRANQLARYLQSIGVGPEDVVALCVERSSQMVIAVLAIHKAGAAYVPLDPAYPDDRLSFMIADAGARVVLTQQPLATSLSGATTVVFIDSSGEEIARHSSEPPIRNCAPEHASYVIYTSGSTGLPKGVIIPNSGICNRLLWGQTEYRLSTGETVIHESSINFDFSVWEIYGPLMAGARTVITRPRGNQDPLYLLKLIAEQNATVVHFVPSMLQHLMAEMDPGTCESVRLIFCGGEALPGGLREELLHSFSGELYNQYGATEASINSTYWVCKSDEPPGIAPLGRPLGNTSIYTLDHKLEPAPIGVRGELHIGGAGIARGYLNRPALTAERFVPDPFGGEHGARLYRTGDVGSYSSDGVLGFHGRKDRQAKVRGFRIELGEIENVLSQHPDIKEAVVQVREDAGTEKSLVAYVVQTGDGTAKDLRAYLQARLPDHMVPSAFVSLECMPITVNGKLDLQALPAPDQSGSLSDADFVAPRTITEELIANIWSRVLGIDRIGIHDNFFELGGHSLLATQVMSRIRETFQLEVPLRHLFELPTPAELSSAIDRLMQEGRQVPVSVIEQINPEGRGLLSFPQVAPSIERVNHGGPRPLSFGQERLWFIEKLGETRGAYNIPRAVRVREGISVTVLEQALGEVKRRHEVLRTRIVEIEGEALQVIGEPERMTLPVVDLSGLGDGESEKEAKRLANEEARREFDLGKGPVARGTMVSVSREASMLLWNMHHIVSDGWSEKVLIREMNELCERYGAGEAGRLEEMKLQYADYAVWQREWLKGEVLEEEVRYWRKQLEGVEVLELPTDRARPAVQSYRGASQTIEISEEVTRKLKEMSRQHGGTEFMVMLAALYVLLMRHTGQHDIVVGTPVAGRNRVELEGMIGFFVNTLALRVDLSGEPSGIELIKRVREAVLAGHAHGELPFEKVVEEVAPERSLSHTPLFQVMMVIEKAGHSNRLNSAQAADAGAQSVRSEAAKFDLTLTVVDAGSRMLATFVYNSDLFNVTRIRRMLEHLQLILKEMTGNPNQPISRLPLLTPAARHQVLEEWSGRKNYSNEGLIQELLLEQVNRTPDKVAAVSESGFISFQALDDHSNRLANFLKRLNP